MLKSNQIFMQNDHFMSSWYYSAPKCPKFHQVPNKHVSSIKKYITQNWMNIISTKVSSSNGEPPLRNKSLKARILIIKKDILDSFAYDVYHFLMRS